MVHKYGRLGKSAMHLRLGSYAQWCSQCDVYGDVNHFTVACAVEGLLNNKRVETSSRSENKQEATLAKPTDAYRTMRMLWIAGILVTVSMSFVWFYMALWPIPPHVSVRYAPWLETKFTGYVKASFDEKRDYFLQEHLNEALRKNPDLSREFLLEKMLGGNVAERELSLECVSVLAEIGVLDDAVREAIKSSISDPNMDVQRQGLLQLKYVPEHDRVKLAIPFLETKPIPHPLASAAMAAFESVNDPKYIPLAIDALRHPDGIVRSYAIYFLHRYESEEVVSALLPILQDREKSVRMHAVFALSEMRDPRVMEALQPLVNDPDKWLADRVREIIDDKNASK